MEFIDSIKLMFAKRSKSPFYGSLVITYIAYNWRLLFILIFDDSFHTVYDKIEFIQDKYIFTYCWGDTIIGWSNLYVPLVFTIVVFILGNILSLGFRWMNVYFKNWQLIVEGHEVWTKEETKEEKKKLEEYEDRISLQSSDLRKQNESLQRQLDEFNTQNPKEDQQKTLKLLQENERIVREQNIFLEQKVKEKTLELDEARKKGENTEEYKIQIDKYKQEIEELENRVKIDEEKPGLMEHIDIIQAADKELKNQWEEEYYKLERSDFFGSFKTLLKVIERRNNISFGSKSLDEDLGGLNLSINSSQITSILGGDIRNDLMRFNVLDYDKSFNLFTLNKKGIHFFNLFSQKTDPNFTEKEINNIKKVINGDPRSDGYEIY